MYWTPSPPAALNRGDGSHALVGGNGQDAWSSQPGPLSWVSLEPGFGEAEHSAAGVSRDLLLGRRQAVPCPPSPVLSWGLCVAL